MARVTSAPSLLRGERTRSFFGPYAQSPNGEFTLIWQDADPTGNAGGYRKSGEGEYLLFHGGDLIAEGRMERPNQGQVSDIGTFILSDWRFGDQLRSTFCAFESSSHALLRREFKANTINSDLSANGRFATFMTADSSNSDANKLTFFDLSDGAVLWSKWPETGTPDAYEFDTAEAILWLVYRNGGRYAYSMTDGEFMDEERWETERIDRASPPELLLIGRDRLKAAGDSLDLQTGSEIAFILKKAIATGIDKYPADHAKVVRTLGELWERLGDDAEALACYERANEIDSKVGVKRRIANIKKRLSEG